MDRIARDVTVPLWADLIPWTIGSVVLNRVVLVNVRGPAAMDRPKPSWFRQAFFLLVGAVIFLVLTTISAGGPLVDLTSADFDRCTGSGPLILALVLSPAVLLILQAAFFQGTGKQLLGDKRGVALASLALSSVLLVMGLRMTRDAFIIPQLCPLATAGRPPGPYD
ncbi:hypothetical protein [Corallococcus silvisoli]|uniref:hypothetical protein n=1 Tax=Corallococcus silvisoli TaxID=2697031 RepID=UPI00137753FC|nr:hypothetical protein [Corallococcus silvisoli]NBD10526.1 hypothetical protein [Corallococcus silvisoli]